MLSASLLRSAAVSTWPGGVSTSSKIAAPSELCYREVAAAKGMPELAVRFTHVESHQVYEHTETQRATGLYGRERLQNRLGASRPLTSASGGTLPGTPHSCLRAMPKRSSLPSATSWANAA